MKRSIFGAIAAVGLMTACASEITTVSNFDAAEVAYFSKAGRAALTGQSLMRQRGGGVVTCAGSSVELIPAGAFAKERISKIYGSSAGGRVGVFSGAGQANVPPAYLSTRRVSVCDAQGNFEFRGLADGDYYLISQITWSVPGSYIPEGGTIARLVKIRGGKGQRAILA